MQKSARKAEYEAIVVGGGVVGSSILFALAARGKRDCLLVERGLFAEGATIGAGAMVRVYHNDWYVANLAAESLPTFLDFERAVGAPCGFERTGSLYFDKAARLPALRLEVGRLNARGGSLELMTRATGGKRFPLIAWDEDAVAVYEPDAGFADPVRATRAWLDGARDLGASAIEGEAVVEISSERGCVTGVRTRTRSYRARRVIVAAGAWTRPLVSRLGWDTSVFPAAIQLAQFRARKAPETFPALYDATTGTFARPAGARATLVGGPAQGGCTAGEEGGLSFDRADAERARGMAARRLGWLAGAELSGGLRFLDSFTTNRRGVLGSSPEIGGLVVASGFSGMGFRMAPAIGRRVAEMVSDT